MTGIHATWLSQRLDNALGKAPAIVIKHLRKALTEISALLEREVIERTPTSGDGKLRGSIGAMPVTISGQSISAGAGTNLAYAIPVELGSKPHWAPILPLLDWVERKLAKHGEEAQEVARLVQLKIAHKGTEGAHMFRDGGEAIRPQFLEMISAGLTAAEAEIEGSAA